MPRPRQDELRLSVSRRIDNYPRGLGDDSALALELHRRRGRALRDALESSGRWTVADWGETDGDRAVLVVRLRLHPDGEPQAAPSIPSALDPLARILRRDGVPETVVARATLLIRQLRPHQLIARILDHEIRLPTGQTLWSDPDGEHLLITVTLAGGERRHVHWREPRPAASGRSGAPAVTPL